jgi:hypothetical protein
MLRTVTPHDFVAVCTACNTTVAAVAEETGLSEATLLDFAAGRLGLSAFDRMRIFGALVKHLPGEPRVSPPDLETVMAMHKLFNEVMQEESEMRACEDSPRSTH